MFTGIITDVGELLALTQGGRLLRIGTSYDTQGIAIGASIAHDGVCLSVIAKGSAPSNWYEVQISDETREKTTLDDQGLFIGRALNLERALRLGDELGGHIVSGHVDGVAKVSELTQDTNGDLVVRFQAPKELARFIAPKGSVTLNGTSLTVNEVAGESFTITLIPHTRAVTSWGAVACGDRVNLEVDTVARYVARLHDCA